MTAIPTTTRFLWASPTSRLWSSSSPKGRRCRTALIALYSKTASFWRERRCGKADHGVGGVLPVSNYGLSWSGADGLPPRVSPRFDADCPVLEVFPAPGREHAERQQRSSCRDPPTAIQWSRADVQAPSPGILEARGSGRSLHLTLRHRSFIWPLKA